MGRPKVIVIGGGSSGSFITHDLASRGFDVTLIERGNIIGGTSSRFHGLLHSGARYAVNDNKTAKEGVEDNQIISRIAEHAVEDTGGIFAALKQDDTNYIEEFIKGCKNAAIPAEEMDVAKLLEEEPFLSKDVSRAFRVPDKVINSFRFITSLLLTAKSEGAKIILNTEVASIDSDKGEIKGVKIKNNDTGKIDTVNGDMIINATGPWVNKILSGTNAKPIDIIPSAGTMAVVGRRFTKHVVNRLRLPSDGDIIVPFFGESIIGTTSFVVKDPDNLEIDEDDPKFLLSEGSKLIPAMKKEGVKRYYAGVRPLLMQAGDNGNGRDGTRDFKLFDHEKEGLQGLITIVGGKLSTSRLMAKSIGDEVCKKFGVKDQSKTTEIKLLWPDMNEKNIKEISTKTNIPEPVLKELVSETSHRTYSDVYSPAKDVVYSRMLF